MDLARLNTHAPADADKRGKCRATLEIGKTGAARVKELDFLVGCHQLEIDLVAQLAREVEEALETRV